MALSRNEVSTSPAWKPYVRSCSPSPGKAAPAEPTSEKTRSPNSPRRSRAITSTSEELPPPVFAGRAEAGPGGAEKREDAQPEFRPQVARHHVNQRRVPPMGVVENQ